MSRFKGKIKTEVHLRPTQLTAFSPAMKMINVDYLITGFDPPPRDVNFGGFLAK